MGTRGVMGVRVSGQDKLTYCHFDSYPDGWPAEMVKDIQKMLEDPGIERMRGLARAIIQVEEDAIPTKEELAVLGLSYEMNPPRKDWYGRLRGLHGKFKRTLELGFMLNSNAFITDSLFCEWGYIANLDDELFEVYEGFQTQPHRKGRFAQTPPEAYSAPGSGNTYYPCALKATFPLAAIPDDWLDQLADQEAA